MKNIFVFGDSFSTNYTLDNQVKVEESWPVLLSAALNRNLLNYANAGMCNGEIINRFIQHYHEIEADDVVIIQTGFFSRFLNPFTNSTIFANDILNGSDHKNLDSNTKQDYDFYRQYMLTLDTYITHDMLKYKFILDYLSIRNIKFFLWSVDPHPFLDKYIINNFSKRYMLYPKDWERITNDRKFWAGNDKHFNALAHNFVFEWFYSRMR